MIAIAYAVHSKPKFKESTGIAKLLENKWYMDEIYDALIVKPIEGISNVFDKFVDRHGIDGIVNGVGKTVRWGGDRLRMLQTGQVGTYIFIMVMGIVVFGTNYKEAIAFSCEWIPMLGTQFSLVADGMSSMLCLLTGIVTLVVFLTNLDKDTEAPGSAPHIGIMVLAGLGIILGAVYTLNMIQKTAYGNTTEMVISKDLSVNEYAGLAIIIAVILYLGIYPKPLLDLTAGMIG
eukprot:gene15051-14850_t